jgi:putative membrane-bound dehydrogenase-like protein
MSRRLRLAFLVLAALGVTAHPRPACAEAGGKGALPPEAALRTLHPRPGFTVELVAAEPLVESPVAFDWGPDGRLWVVEMRDYPLGMDNKGKPGGRVVCLEDTDGDGRFDRSTVFLDGLLFPTGVMSWGKGLLVTCAPDIFYAEDTDGDGRADRREVILTGFGEANPQHRVNGLRWGLDNWVYCANGDFAPVRTFAPAGPADPSATGFSPSQAEDLRRLALAGARVRSVRQKTTCDIRNRDFRIRPDEGLLDPQSGQAQFGRDRDDWGNWFGCDHAVPMWHYALDDHYLRRNPHVAAPAGRVEAPRSVTFALGTGRDTGTPRNPRGNAWTSACSVMVYRDNLFGPDFSENWFACEPVHNLVHRELLRPAGATFTSRRAADEPAGEFLASDDPLFTPVSIRTGPDGALWVADMYRKVLEHPHWLPPGWEKTVDVRAGHDKGRIYRFYPSGKKPRPWPRLDRLDATGLVALLDSPNGWLRDKAQQMLVRRGDRSAVAALEARVSKGETALGRLHALCTLDGLQSLRPEVLRQVLGDAHPGVRRHAVRLSETPAARSPQVEAALVKAVGDPDPAVRLQLAYSLGAWDSAGCGRALGRLLRQNAGDPYIAAAALSSLTQKNLAAVAEAALAAEDLPPALTQGLLQSAVGFGEPRAAAALLNHLARPRDGRYGPGQFSALAGWLDSLDQRNTPLPRLAAEADEHLRADLARLSAVFEAARKAARDPKTALPERVQAVRLLGRGLERQQEDRAVLVDLLAPQTAEELQAAAVATLGQLRSPEIAEDLLKGWKGCTPKLRAQVLDTLLRRPDGAAAVLDALRGKRIVPQEVPLTARQRLLEHPSKGVRERAASLFTDLLDPDRNKVVLAYRAALRLEGDPGRGVRVFTKWCATCHRLGAVGNAVGPDLAMVRDKPPEWFLPALFDPSRAVDARFLNYVAVTREGKTFTGVLAEEGGNSITLVGPTGERHVLLRTNLDELTSTGKSAMPEGLEKDLKPQDVADLIAYLRSQGPPPNK